MGFLFELGLARCAVILTAGGNLRPFLGLAFETARHLPSEGIPCAIHQSISQHSLEQLACAWHLVRSLPQVRTLLTCLAAEGLRHPSRFRECASSFVPLRAWLGGYCRKVMNWPAWPQKAAT